MKCIRRHVFHTKLIIQHKETMKYCLLTHNTSSSTFAVFYLLQNACKMCMWLFWLPSVSDFVFLKWHFVVSPCLFVLPCQIPGPEKSDFTRSVTHSKALTRTNFVISDPECSSVLSDSSLILRVNKKKSFLSCCTSTRYITCKKTCFKWLAD